MNCESRRGFLKTTASLSLLLLLKHFFSGRSALAAPESNPKLGEFRCINLYSHEYHQYTLEFMKKLLANGYEPLSIPRMAEHFIEKKYLDPGGNYCHLFLDDGYASVFEKQLPELAEFNWNRIGQGKEPIYVTLMVPLKLDRPSLDDPIQNLSRDTWLFRDRDPKHVYGTLGQLIEAMQNYDWLTIGDHGILHENLATNPKSAWQAEIKTSKDRLFAVAGLAGVPLRNLVFAPPMGHFAYGMPQFLAEQGFQLAFGTEFVDLQTPERQFSEGRVADWAFQARYPQFFLKPLPTSTFLTLPTSTPTPAPIPTHGHGGQRLM